MSLTAPPLSKAGPSPQLQSAPEGLRAPAETDRIHTDQPSLGHLAQVNMLLGAYMKNDRPFAFRVKPACLQLKYYVCLVRCRFHG